VVPANLNAEQDLDQNSTKSVANYQRAMQPVGYGASQNCGKHDKCQGKIYGGIRHHRSFPRVESNDLPALTAITLHCSLPSCCGKYQFYR
jgi:hypothetical protein